MIVTAIDPGTSESGYVLVDISSWRVLASGIYDNDTILCMLSSCTKGQIVLIETPSASGVPMGHDLVKTILYTGRYQQATLMSGGNPVMITRKDVKKAMLGKVVGNDAMVNAMVRAFLCGYHGITEKQLKGTSKAPGPCYGVRSHAWAALAVVVAAYELRVND